ncbi:hypothetical protein B0T25DRAFT_617686 [Lasiosphaeria hispida]|uniref:Uncharacterized protein n=1 Tax=Lasiosphaeria hispida TaxID=260671 RepID=A0AAJ0H7F2_9PEZI|nr:hypothetical protein B0T25DRAFT_617686 [Lasiosphaeria hispida]
MSRLAHGLKSAFGFPRISQAAKVQGPQGQAIILHRVKMSKKIDMRRRIHSIAISSIVTYFGYKLLGELGVFDDLDFNDSFIRLSPFATQVVAPQPYAGTDPEWKGFVKVAHDKPLQEKIRRDLANFTLARAKQSNMLAAYCGKDMTIRRFWIDLDYPFLAPPVYGLIGVLITEDGFKWAAMPVEASTAKMINRIVWPMPAAVSLWSVCKAIARQKTTDVARYLGFPVKEPTPHHGPPNPSAPKPNPRPTQNTQLQKAVERMRQQATKRPDEVGDPRTATPGTAPLNTSVSPRKGASGSGDTQATEPGFWSANRIRNIVGHGPWQTFADSLRNTWQRQLPDAPRGCIAVSGLVELETPTAWVVIDVFAWYNPKTRGLDESSIRLPLRRLQYKRQMPLK